MFVTFGRMVDHVNNNVFTFLVKYFLKLRKITDSLQRKFHTDTDTQNSIECVGHSLEINGMLKELLVAMGFKQDQNINKNLEKQNKTDSSED